MSSIPLAASPPAGRRTIPRADALVWPMLAISLLAGLHLSNLFGRAVNWDEFYHYTQIHELLSGTLTKPMQTLQARLFAWVSLLPGDNIGHILAARGVMFGCMLAAAGAIYALAMAFVERKVALVCALAWMSAGFVLQHATSYRPDALAAALLMTSLAVMARSRLGPGTSLLIAALAAVAALVTIKAALYAPAFAGIAWLRWQEAGRTREATLRVVLLAVMVPALFGLFYLAHVAFLPDARSGGELLAASANKMFLPFTFPYAHHAIKAALTAPVLALAVATSPVLIWRAVDLSRAEKLALSGLWLPITTIAFYHNSAAYYYVFMLPPVAVACAIALRAMIARYSLLAISAVCALAALAVWGIEDRAVQVRQRTIVNAADEIFSEPVAYFDFAGMIGHFPKANAFLTPWGASGYRTSGAAHSMAAIMARRAVPLVLENDPMLTAALVETGEVPELRAGDVAVLRDSYIRFWGPYWLAGEELDAGEGRAAMIRVPGPYTIADGAIAVDGVLHPAGAVIPLDRGMHHISAPTAPARLIWGDNLPLPTAAVPEGPYWTQF